MDAVILRPSIVLSHGVESAKFARSILWVLPVMRRLGVVPLTGREPIDAVSVQFVAECVARMVDWPLRHRIYHLSAGLEASITLAGLFQALSQQGHDYSPICFQPKADWTTDFADGADEENPCHPFNPWLGMRLKGLLDYYLPFLAAGPVYANDRLAEALGTDLPACPRLSEYCADLLEMFTEHEACQEALRP